MVNTQVGCKVSPRMLSGRVECSNPRPGHSLRARAGHDGERKARQDGLGLGSAGMRRSARSARPPRAGSMTLD